MLLPWQRQGVPSPYYLTPSRERCLPGTTQVCRWQGSRAAWCALAKSTGESIKTWQGESCFWCWVWVCLGCQCDQSTTPPRFAPTYTSYLRCLKCKGHAKARLQLNIGNYSIDRTEQLNKIKVSATLWSIDKQCLYVPRLWCHPLVGTLLKHRLSGISLKSRQNAWLHHTGKRSQKGLFGHNFVFSHMSFACSRDVCDCGASQSNLRYVSKCHISPSVLIIAAKDNLPATQIDCGTVWQNRFAEKSETGMSTWWYWDAHVTCLWLKLVIQYGWILASLGMVVSMDASADFACVFICQASATCDCSQSNTSCSRVWSPDPRVWTPKTNTCTQIVNARTCRTSWNLRSINWSPRNLSPFSFLPFRLPMCTDMARISYAFMIGSSGWKLTWTTSTIVLPSLWQVSSGGCRWDSTL